MKAKFTMSKMSKIVFIMALTAIFFGCKKDFPDKPESPFEINVVLNGEGKGNSPSGFIKFRQDPDTARIIDLDTWVIHLSPNHSYLLQRAVNPIADPNGCTSTAWLTLGRGLQPLAIETDAHGAGHADFWRDVTAVARGTGFHIHFQVIDATTLATVLTSDCYDYTVR